MAKKAYVNDGSDWVELASATTDLTGYATETYVNTSISNLVDAAPTALNTLNELAAALGDDANFASTITSLIADKISNVPGMISQYAGSSLPSGWLWCDGGDIQVSTHQNLYNALTSNGTVFPYGPNTNANGVIYFKVPNFTGRVPVGKDDSQTEFDALGETGGAKTHTLTTAEMPSHQHTFSRANEGPFGGIIGSNGHGGTIQETLSTSATGGGGAHNNLQPYVVINYIIRY